MKTQPKPKKNKNKHVVDEVIAELKHRKRFADSPDRRLGALG